MNKDSKIDTILELLSTAETNLNSAKSLVKELSSSKKTKTDKKSTPEVNVSDEENNEEEGKVVEGVFDGQTMIDAEGKKYPVPANYASKSKLVAGDILKLTIQDDGRFLYKQIGPVDRKTVIGILEQEGSHFRVIANGKNYNVLLASVTYFKAKPGDEVTIIIPANEDSDWACIENVLAIS